MRSRYFIAQDNDGHWYIVPVVMRAMWDAWCNLDPDDERAWTPPAGVQEIGGSPSLVTFTDPVIG